MGLQDLGLANLRSPVHTSQLEALTQDSLAPLEVALPAAALPGCPRKEDHLCPSVRSRRPPRTQGPRAVINAAASPSSSSASYLARDLAQLLADN